MDAVEFDRRIRKIVAHAGDAFGADCVNVAVVRLFLGQVPVDKSLGDVEYHSIGKGAVGLHPPGIFVVPHANALSVPGFVFALRVPAGDVDVVHAAVMERRTFGIVAFQRHVAGRHVADADHGQIADLALGDEALDIFVIPGIAIEEIDGDEAVAGFDLVHEVPFCGYVGANRFFRQHVFPVCQSMANLLRACICQGEQTHGIDGRVAENRLRAFVDGGVG